MVREELQRHDRERGREQLVGRWDADDLVGVLRDLLVAVGGEGDDHAGARADLLDVREHLLVDGVAERDGHHRQVLVDERVRAVLHLAGRGPLGVDVRELLELQRTLERRGVVHAAAEMQEVLGLVVAVGQRADLRLLAQHRVDERRQVEHLGQELGRDLRHDRAAPLRQVDGEEVEVDQHRGVRLRRRDADLRTGVQVDDVVRDARRLAADHVRERQQARAALLRRVHRGERVGGLAGLGDRDRELAGRHHRIAVAVLRRDLHIAGDAGETFDQVLAHERGV